MDKKDLTNDDDTLIQQFLNDLSTKESYKANIKPYKKRILEKNKKIMNISTKIIGQVLANKEVNDPMAHLNAVRFIKETIDINNVEFIDAIVNEVLPVMIQIVQSQSQSNNDETGKNYFSNIPDQTQATIGQSLFRLILESIKAWGISYKNSVFSIYYEDLLAQNIQFPKQFTYFKELNNIVNETQHSQISKEQSVKQQQQQSEKSSQQQQSQKDNHQEAHLQQQSSQIQQQEQQQVTPNKTNYMQPQSGVERMRQYIKDTEYIKSYVQKVLMESDEEKQIQQLSQIKNNADDLSKIFETDQNGLENLEDNETDQIFQNQDYLLNFIQYMQDHPNKKELIEKLRNEYLNKDQIYQLKQKNQEKEEQEHNQRQQQQILQNQSEQKQQVIKQQHYQQQQNQQIQEEQKQGFYSPDKTQLKQQNNGNFQKQHSGFQQIIGETNQSKIQLKNGQTSRKLDLICFNTTMNQSFNSTAKRSGQNFYESGNKNILDQFYEENKTNEDSSSQKQEKHKSQGTDQNNNNHVQQRIESLIEQRNQWKLNYEKQNIELQKITNELQMIELENQHLQKQIQDNFC